MGAMVLASATIGLAGAGLLGMGTANLPYEFLPAFWQDWIYPWMPLRFLAEGARALAFQGAALWNGSTAALSVTALVGAAALITSAWRPQPSQSLPNHSGTSA